MIHSYMVVALRCICTVLHTAQPEDSCKLQALQASTSTVGLILSKKGTDHRKYNSQDNSNRNLSLSIHIYKYFHTYSISVQTSMDIRNPIANVAMCP